MLGAEEPLLYDTDMKERFALAYYLLFMFLGIGGSLNYLVVVLLEPTRYAEPFVFPIIIALLMTISRWLYNGEHPSNMPIEKPSNIKIIGFVLLSFFLVHKTFSGIYF